MTGQQALVKLRRAGKKPACVWVWDNDETDTAQKARDWHEQPNPFAGKVFAHLRIEALDIPETLDFRCLVGLQVHLFCERDAGRARRVFDSLSAADPAFLIAVQGDEVWTHGAQHG